MTANIYRVMELVRQYRQREKARPEPINVSQAKALLVSSYPQVFKLGGEDLLLFLEVTAAPKRTDHLHRLIQ